MPPPLPSNRPPPAPPPRAGTDRGAAYNDTYAGNLIYGPLDDEREAARARYEDYLRQTGQVRDAPVVNASTVRTPDDVVATDPGQLERVGNLERVGPAERVGVTAESVARGVTSRDVAAPGMPSMMEADAERIAGARIDDRQGQQIRNDQLSYIESLKAAAEGRAPSVAQAQFDAAKGDIVRGALGTAAQARGADAGAARIEAIGAIADQTRRMALDNATLRAKEITDARGALGGTLAGVRGQDTAVATDQAGFDQATQQSNQATAAETSRFNAGQGNEIIRQNVALTHDAATGNADRALAADQFTAGAQNERDQYLAGLRAQIDAGNADRSLDAATIDAAAANRAIETNAAAANRRGEFTATQRDAVNVGNVDRRVAVESGNADRTQGAATGNADRIVTQRGQDDARDASLRGAAETAAGTATDAAATRATSVVREEEGKAERRNKLIGGIIGGIAGAGAAAAGRPPVPSDARLKTDIDAESPREVDDFLEALQAVNYEYRDPANGKGEQHGILAQDLEKSDIGRSLVVNRPDGKHVDTEKLTLALAGAVARMHRELRGRRAA